MTAEEQFLIDNFPEEESGFGISSLHNVHRRVFIDILRKYASQQAKEQWNAAIDAALCSGDHFGLGEDIYLDKNTVEKLKKS
jgi:hypothetical protein